MIHRSDLDETTAGELEAGMLLWWHGEARRITKVQHLPATERYPYPKTAVTFAGHFHDEPVDPRQALLGSGVDVAAAWPDVWEAS